jgi:hypothetical protein
MRAMWDTMSVFNSCQAQREGQEELKHRVNPSQPSPMRTGTMNASSGMSLTSSSRDTSKGKDTIKTGVAHRRFS